MDASLLPRREVTARSAPLPPLQARKAAIQTEANKIMNLEKELERAKLDHLNGIQQHGHLYVRPAPCLETVASEPNEQLETRLAVRVGRHRSG